MTYRKFDTNTWQDPWFEGLSPKAKLAFIYLWTNESCNQAGIYEISKKRISFDLGYGIDTIYSEVKNKIQWFEDRSVVWVKNFFKRQCQNQKFAVAAINSIKQDPFKLSVFIDHNRHILETVGVDLSEYHIDTISIPYPTEQNRTEADTEQKQPCPPKTADDYSDDFKEFWKHYPKKVQKGAAWKAWKKIKSPKETLAKVQTALIWQKKSEQWSKNNGQFIPHPATYLNASQWEDEPDGSGVCLSHAPRSREITPDMIDD